MGYLQARKTCARALFILSFVLTQASLSGGAAVDLSALLPLESHMLARSMSTSPSPPVPYTAACRLAVSCWVPGLFLTIITFHVQSPAVLPKLIELQFWRVKIITQAEISLSTMAFPPEWTMLSNKAYIYSKTKTMQMHFILCEKEHSCKSYIKDPDFNSNPLITPTM